MIIVTGATGQLGRGIVGELLGRLPADQIVASARDTARAKAFSERGVDVRPGDFAKPEGLAKAFSGATQVLVVSVDKLGEEALRMHRAAIQAARGAGARRVLYTSHMGARADSPFAPASDHAATEAFLAGGGGSYTSLRHGFYAESALHLIGHDLEAGEIRAPEDGPVSWTARGFGRGGRDRAGGRGAARRDTPPLTAPEAFTLSDLAAIASELTGREIKRVVVSDDAWRDAKVAQGVPAPMAEMLLGTYRAARRGDFAAVDSTLGVLLGRCPRTMRDVLAASLKPSEA